MNVHKERTFLTITWKTLIITQDTGKLDSEYKVYYQPKWDTRNV